MNIKSLVIASLLLPGSVQAQGQAQAPAQPQVPEALPSRFAELELARSRTCVGVLHRLEALNLELQPFGLRAERLKAAAGAIALEDRSIAESLDASDEVENAVKKWFVADGQLANRYLETQDESLQQQRMIAREQIKNTVGAAIQEVQTAGQAILEASGTLSEEAAPCDGAILIRSAVLEVCATTDGVVCDAASRTNEEGALRFVDSPEDLWDVQELRPWSAPGRIQVGADGQLEGANTAAFARHGNIVLSVSFAPLIRERSAMEAADVARFQATLDSIGFVFEHPSLIYVPSLAIQSTISDPLADEEFYVLHFGTADDADIVWTGRAGEGRPISAPVALEPSQIVRLQAGHPLTLTAVKTGVDEENEAIYSLELTSVNQSNATQQLLGYMAEQMATDLLSLVPRRGG